MSTEFAPLDRKVFAELTESDPKRVDRVADAVAEAVQDPIVSASLSVVLYARRLSLIAMTAVNRQLGILIPQEDQDMALRIVRETSQAMRELGKFTVHDLEADTCELVPPYFEGLAAATMFQMKIEEDDKSTVADVLPAERAAKFESARKRATPRKSKRRRSS